MFDFRYHVASLVAVFFALAVGVLLGVAISGKLSDAQSSLDEGRIDDLNQRLESARSRADAADRRQQTAEDLVERAYPTLMEGRLEDKVFAILFLGPVQGDVRSAVERTLADAGSGGPVRLIAIDTPVDAADLDEVLSGNEALAAYAEGGEDFGELGEALGRELIEGGESPLWTALSSELVEERSGTSSIPADGAIVVYSWTPPEESDSEATAAALPTLSLMEGLLEGLANAPFPAVGVETSTSERSQIELYRREGMSSVDNVDTLAGRLALALLLAGGQPGHYGLKDSASDGVAPPIEPLLAETSAG